MAVQLSKKKPLAALGSRGIHCRVVGTLAFAAFTTLTFAQNGARDHARAQNYGFGDAPHGAMGWSAGPVPGMDGGTRIEHQLMSGRRILEATQATATWGTLHAVRYGNGVTGVVEHPIKSGYLSRTYVQGGRVLYARVYCQNKFQRFGHTFAYERLVPGVAFGAAYYAWAARPWSTPVNYRWGWEAEPWHRAYGRDFTPYSNYSSLDQWLTDYVIAQNLRNAYESRQAEQAPTNPNGVRVAPPVPGPRPYWESSEPAQRPYWESPDAGGKPYWEESADPQPQQAQPKGSKKARPAPKSRAGSKPASSADDAPPALSGDIKSELNAQIKQRLAERQTQTTSLATDDLPDSLKPGHTLFRVNTPLDVPSGASGGYCSLKPNDYIQRTGDMDSNGTVPVKVRLGAASDCSIGLATHVSVNDLEAMDNEQQQALTDALLAASKNMGGSGLPQAPSTTPVLLAAGQTQPLPDAGMTLSQLQ